MGRESSTETKKGREGERERESERERERERVRARVVETQVDIMMPKNKMASYPSSISVDQDCGA